MTTKKSAVKKSTLPTISPAPVPEVPVSASIIALNETSLRAVATLAASIMFSQPQFAAQVNPSNILGLADLFFKYMSGAVNVSQPSENTSEVAASTFG